MVNVKVSAVMNAYFCAETIPFVLEAVYPHLHQILITYGRDGIWNWPEDNTLEILKSFPDPQNKIKIIVQKVWKGGSKDRIRIRRREACLEHMTGTHLMILDGDEIWTGFNHYIRALQEGRIKGGCPLGVTFWHNERWQITNQALSRWGEPCKYLPYGTIWPHTRIVPWKKGYKWIMHVVPKDEKGNKLWQNEWNRDTVKALGTDCVLYHMGNMLTQHKMKTKKRFYAETDNKSKEEAAWLNWTEEKGAGVGGDGHVLPITHKIHGIVRRCIKAIHEADK